MDPYIFITKNVDAPQTVPVDVIIPTLNGTKMISLNQTFTFLGDSSVNNTGFPTYAIIIIAVVVVVVIAIIALISCFAFRKLRK